VFGLAVVQGRHQFGHPHSGVSEWQVAAEQPRQNVVDPRAPEQHRHRNAYPRRPPADGGGGDLVQLADAHVPVGDDVAFAASPVFRGQKHCLGGVFDAHHLGRIAQVEGEPAVGDEGKHGAVRGGRPISGAVGGRYAHRNGGQALVMRVRQQHFLGRKPCFDVCATLVPVVCIVLVDHLAVADRQSACSAGEYELLQVGVTGRVQHVPQALDIRLEQRRRVTQPHPGIDDAVVDDITAGHRRAQGIVIEDIPIAALDIEVIDALGRTGAAQHDSYVGTRGDKLTCDMRSQEAAGPDHQLLLATNGYLPSMRSRSDIAGPVQP
jgi:hypothetical protein